MKPKTILVIEDEKALMMIIEKTLKSAGFEVVTALDGMAGMEAAVEGSADLVILDIMLPKISGYKILEVLKEFREKRTLPVIILSARAKNEDMKRALAAGADLYITKPFSPLQLLERVREFLA
ncbi:MAG: two-component system response regulator [Candidatus Wallbacteria bacterium HGW-Wallbacteria-1]|jgi:DNA-binding response OmpR family regulator|uniref:Two-component system response regulator n=1 Tax=Candidatus Wallbacteria bacterium HGW-Wallbacteria-1 TaxID=2013854 RepID=A0A2N1PSB1_9BACT|nr:MAG: two-component system response regulator [Candidatus Wallbacteria bacterium HGW-Wallbacteria-1]